ncbi:Vacuolar protein sorting-associated protein Ist1 [Trypanosoma melophagium]|uniref:Vacuolar protein sorting-associated protein Ist1 n=1 Tax=Trypanosoma melophagium TaxID=715481 RepID=UPI00351A1DBA|nr:Vacuolar protein sorting-associated protein Ist1 [Trypanosoma melophagium]
MKSFFSKKISGIDPLKLKANIRMAVTRVRMQQNKLVNSVKIQRRQLAELLALQKYDAARIRVEQVIRDDVSIEGLEVLALFLDLIANRIQLLTEKGSDAAHCPPELKESITSVLWASARVGDSVPELQAVRKYFENRYGKGFVAMSVSNAEFSVNQKIIDRLGVFTPSNASCLEYLTNVATEYGIEGYDEEKLRDPNGLVASAAAATGGAVHGDNGAAWKDDAAAKAALASGNVIKTPSGLLIPALTTPRDDLEWRLLQLKRE